MRQGWEVILNRKEAIQRAVELAGDKDRIIITGRGHETRYVGDQIESFSDEDIVMRSLQDMGQGIQMMTPEL